MLAFSKNNKKQQQKTAFKLLKCCRGFKKCWYALYDFYMVSCVSKILHSVHLGGGTPCRYLNTLLYFCQGVK